VALVGSVGSGIGAAPAAAALRSMSATSEAAEAGSTAKLKVHGAFPISYIARVRTDVIVQASRQGRMRCCQAHNDNQHSVISACDGIL
jgi:hypothetical protein